MSVALLAAFVWILSIPFVAYTGYGGGGYPGYMVLLFGWGVHHAWYANVTFFTVFIMLAAGRSSSAAFYAFFLSGIGVALSLTAATLKSAPELNVVYGFGLGAVVWLAANQIMCVAAAMRLQETIGDNRHVLIRASPVIIATLAVVVLTGGAVAMAVFQKRTATGEDLQMLKSHTVLKLVPLCNSTIEAQPLQWPRGVVEIEESQYSPSSHDYILDLKRLHASGVDVSRYEKITMRTVDPLGVVFATKDSDEPPAAIVRIRAERPATDVESGFSMLRRQEGLRVTILVNGAEVRTAHWEFERGSTYCPRIRHAGEARSTVEQYVVETLKGALSARKSSRVLAEAKQLRIHRLGTADPQPQSGSRRESAASLIDISCADRLDRIDPATKAYANVAKRYRVWPAFRLAHASDIYFLDRENTAFRLVKIACEASRFTLIGLEEDGGSLQLISLTHKDASVVDWRYVSLPALRQVSRPGWDIGEVAIGAGGYRFVLVNAKERTKAELLVER